MKLTSPDGTAFRGDYTGARRARLRRPPLVPRPRAPGLRARRAGVEVREGVRAPRRRLARRRRRAAWSWKARTRPESACEARLVVAADGRRSVVARQLGLLREHRTLRKFAVRGYWDGSRRASTDHGEMHVARRRLLRHRAPRRRRGQRHVRARPARDGGRRAATSTASTCGRCERWPRIARAARRGPTSSAPRARSGPWPWRRAACPRRAPCWWATPPGSTTRSPARA